MQGGEALTGKELSFLNKAFLLRDSRKARKYVRMAYEKPDLHHCADCDHVTDSVTGSVWIRKIQEHAKARVIGPILLISLVGLAVLQYFGIIDVSGIAKSVRVLY